MAPYLRCPSCNKIMGNRYSIYSDGLKKIYANKSYSKQDKLDKTEELVQSLLLRSCCNQRLITTINKETILVT
jgi:DNA-directed RNA polymerase subunit N (RpoN/RPB10)